MLSTSMRRLVRVWTLFVLVFLYAPLLLVMLNAFNTSKTFAFPPSGFTLRWWGDAWASTGMWRSLGNSMVVGLCATALALTLGTMAAFAVLFGTRHIDATEHQDGLMLAIAAESIVKLVAFVAVGVFVTFWMFDGPTALFTQAMERPDTAAVLTRQPPIATLTATTAVQVQ